jgi:hypothetical protein
MLKSPEDCEDMFQRSIAAQEIAAQDRLCSYLQRGRKLAPMPLLRLRVLYIKAECDFALGAPHAKMSREGEDAEAELTMRGEPLPEAEIVTPRELMRTEILAWVDAHPEAFIDAEPPPMYTRPKGVN